MTTNTANTPDRAPARSFLTSCRMEEVILRTAFPTDVVIRVSDDFVDDIGEHVVGRRMTVWSSDRADLVDRAIQGGARYVDFCTYPEPPIAAHENGGDLSKILSENLKVALPERFPAGGGSVVELPLDDVAKPRAGERAAKKAGRIEKALQMPGASSIVSELNPPFEMGLSERLAELPENHTGAAMRLRERFGDQIRWTKSRGWLAWTGTRFQDSVRDAGEQMVGMMAQRVAYAVRYEAAAFDDDDQKARRISWSDSLGNMSGIRGMTELCAARVTISTAALDANLMAFNCANGTINLVTGGLSPHDQIDLITKISPVSYDPAATCPWFEKFVAAIMQDDGEMVAFLQRLMGYALTGSIHEQKMACFWGSGSNGKSTLIEIMAEVMGEYACGAAISTFMTKDRSGGVPNDLAMLAGARFVSAVEPNQGVRLDEGLIKSITGGDRVVARFLNKEFFEFVPQLLLILGLNYKPPIRGTDNGIWRRILLVPFRQQFVDIDDKRAAEGFPVKDETLGAKLRDELPGILAWCVRGCLEWQKTGLRPPEAVIESTKSYRGEQDVLSDFLSTCTENDPKAQITAGSLYKAYCAWASLNQQQAVSQTAFGRSIPERGYEKIKSSLQHYLGLRLNADGLSILDGADPVGLAVTTLDARVSDRRTRY